MQKDFRDGVTAAGAANKAACLAADNLMSAGIAHGFFLRTGGVSEGIYASLNCGRGSQDNREHVEENRRRAAALLGVSAARLTGPKQTHTATALAVTEPWAPGLAPEADAVVTNVRGLALSVLTADCAPILLADAEAGVVAAAHAGWKGAKAGIIESTISVMESLGARASRISAAIGPAISQAAYEVSPEFQISFLADGQENGRYFAQEPDGKPHFNLPAFVRSRLERKNVASIEDIAACTYRNESILFSYRRATHRFETDYGRQISAILIL